MVGYVVVGFYVVKVKIGFGVVEDLEVICVVWDVIGFDMCLMIDVNYGYDLIEVICFGKVVVDYDIDWFEELVIFEYFVVYCDVWVGQFIFVVGGEIWYMCWGFCEFLEICCVDIV